ncbi:MAG: hypothetical protein ACKPFA_00450 [Dolichospermum sp.]
MLSNRIDNLGGYRGGVRREDLVYGSLVKSDRVSAAELEREIDEIVYKLYGLTEEDIKIIQDSVKQK